MEQPKNGCCKEKENQIQKRMFLLELGKPYQKHIPVYILSIGPVNLLCKLDYIRARQYSRETLTNYP